MDLPSPFSYHAGSSVAPAADRPRAAPTTLGPCAIAAVRERLIGRVARQAVVTEIIGNGQRYAFGELPCTRISRGLVAWRRRPRPLRRVLGLLLLRGHSPGQKARQAAPASPPDGAGL